MEQREELSSFSGECFMDFVDVLYTENGESLSLLELPNR